MEVENIALENEFSLQNGFFPFQWLLEKMHNKYICYSLVLLFNLWREVKCILLKITRSTRSNFLWRVEVRSGGFSELDDTSSFLLRCVMFLFTKGGVTCCIPRIPSRELTYPTWGIGKSSSKVPEKRICWFPGGYMIWLVIPTTANLKNHWSRVWSHRTEGWLDICQISNRNKSVMLDFPSHNTRHYSTTVYTKGYMIYVGEAINQSRRFFINKNPMRIGL